MSDARSGAGFLSRTRKKKEREDIRKYMPVLGKVLNSRKKTDTKWKTREKWKNKKPNLLDKTETTALRSIPAIALSNGVRKKSNARKNHTSPSKSAERSDTRVLRVESMDNVENTPPLTNSTHPPSLPDLQQTPDLHHDVIKQASPIPEAVSSKTPVPTPNETVYVISDESDQPLSWDSVIDGSLPSQPHTRYNISDSTLAAVMNCDTQQILAELQ